MPRWKLIIFDIDGTLTTTKSGETFRKSADDWEWLTGRLEKLKELSQQGARFALASNQAGVAFPWSKFSQEEMQKEIDRVGEEIGSFYNAVCYSTPNEKALPQYFNANDQRRKPGPGMLLEAMECYREKYGELLEEHTLMVGDRSEDQAAASSAGVYFLHAESFFNQE